MRNRIIGLTLIVVSLLSLAYLFTHIPPWSKEDKEKIGAYEEASVRFAAGLTDGSQNIQILRGQGRAKVTAVVMSYERLLQETRINFDKGEKVQLRGNEVASFNEKGELVKMFFVTRVIVMGSLLPYLEEDYQSGYDLKYSDIVSFFIEDEFPSITNSKALQYIQRERNYDRNVLNGGHWVFIPRQISVTRWELSKFAP